MRKVFFAGAAVAGVFVVANRAIVLLNEPSNLAVAAGYFLLIAMVAVGFEYGPRIWRRL
jgi:hypothetical protein